MYEKPPGADMSTRKRKTSTIETLARNNKYNQNGDLGLPVDHLGSEEKIKKAAPIKRRIKVGLKNWQSGILQYIKLIPDLIYIFVKWFIRFFLFRWNGPIVGEDPCEHQLERKWELMWYDLPDYSRAIVFMVVVLIIYFLLLRSGIETSAIKELQEGNFYTAEYIDKYANKVVLNKYNLKFITRPADPVDTERLNIVLNGTRRYQKVNEEDFKLGHKEVYMKGKFYNISLGELFETLRGTAYECVGAPNYGVPLNIVLYGPYGENRMLVVDPEFSDVGKTRVHSEVRSNLGERPVVSPKQARITFLTENGHISRETVQDVNSMCIAHYWELANKRNLEQHLNDMFLKEN